MWTVEAAVDEALSVTVRVAI
jgi:hypothetical protein